MSKKKAVFIASVCLIALVCFFLFLPKPTSALPWPGVCLIALDEKIDVQKLTSIIEEGKLGKVTSAYTQRYYYNDFSGIKNISLQETSSFFLENDPRLTSYANTLKACFTAIAPNKNYNLMYVEPSLGLKEFEKQVKSIKILTGADYFLFVGNNANFSPVQIISIFCIVLFALIFSKRKFLQGLLFSAPLFLCVFASSEVLISSALTSLLFLFLNDTSRGDLQLLFTKRKVKDFIYTFLSIVKVNKKIFVFLIPSLLCFLFFPALILSSFFYMLLLLGLLLFSLFKPLGLGYKMQETHEFKPISILIKPRKLSKNAYFRLVPYVLAFSALPVLSETVSQFFFTDRAELFSSIDAKEKNFSLLSIPVPEGYTAAGKLTILYDSEMFSKEIEFQKAFSMKSVESKELSSETFPEFKLDAAGRLVLAASTSLENYAKKGENPKVFESQSIERLIKNYAGKRNLVRSNKPFLYKAPVPVLFPFALVLVFVLFIFYIVYDKREVRFFFEEENKLRGRRQIA